MHLVIECILPKILNRFGSYLREYLFDRNPAMGPVTSLYFPVVWEALLF